MFKLRLLSADL